MKKILSAILLIFVVVVPSAYSKPLAGDRVTVSIVTDTSCSYCMVDRPQETVRYYFPGAVFKKIDYRSKDGQAILKKHNSKSLPLITLPLSVAVSPNFKQMSNIISENSGEFLLTSQASGVFMFLGREYVPDRMDYFFDFYDVRTEKTFPILMDFCKAHNIKLNIIFIVPTKPVFGYPQQEIKSALAVQKLYSEQLNDYLLERIKFIETIDCTTSVSKLGMDFKAVLAQSDPRIMGELLKNNEALVKELGITNGNAVLVNNQKLFMVFEAKKEDFAKVMNRK